MKGKWSFLFEGSGECVLQRRKVESSWINYGAVFLPFFAVAYLVFITTAGGSYLEE